MPTALYRWGEVMILADVDSWDGNVVHLCNQRAVVGELPKETRLPRYLDARLVNVQEDENESEQPVQ